jgi:hypothetical protein
MTDLGELVLTPRARDLARHPEVMLRPALEWIPLFDAEPVSQNDKNDAVKDD